jgi:hypothetical protein
LNIESHGLGEWLVEVEEAEVVEGLGVGPDLENPVGEVVIKLIKAHLRIPDPEFFFISNLTQVGEIGVETHSPLVAHWVPLSQVELVLSSYLGLDGLHNLNLVLLWGSLYPHDEGVIVGV